jgi:hypothetical protein
VSQEYTSTTTARRSENRPPRGRPSRRLGADRARTHEFPDSSRLGLQMRPLRSQLRSHRAQERQEREEVAARTPSPRTIQDALLDHASSAPRRLAAGAAPRPRFHPRSRVDVLGHDPEDHAVAEEDAARFAIGDDGTGAAMLESSVDTTLAAAARACGVRGPIVARRTRCRGSGSARSRRRDRGRSGVFCARAGTRASGEGDEAPARMPREQGEWMLLIPCRVDHDPGGHRAETTSLVWWRQTKSRSAGRRGQSRERSQPMASTSVRKTPASTPISSV